MSAARANLIMLWVGGILIGFAIANGVFDGDLTAILLGAAGGLLTATAAWALLKLVA